MGQITTTQNLVAIKEVRHTGQRPWLRSLLFCGLIDLDLQGQI